MTIGRLVIVPEFQGFGVGLRFINEIAELYNSDRVRITTSLKPFMMALNVNDKWKCVRSGRVGKPGKSSAIHNTSKSCSVSRDRITATFQYNKRVNRD